MEAKELRIGNYVHHKANTWSSRVDTHPNNKSFDFIWDESDWYGLCQGLMFLEYIEPIPITEEWLLRFGFEENDGMYNNFVIPCDEVGSKHSARYVKSPFEDENGWFYNNDQSDASCYEIRKIEHVHQLQNLYFALTGNELKLKE